jgi:hypothetical protein
VLNFRAGLPPVVTTAHVQAVLASPTAAERETAQLVGAGTLRRVVVPRRGGIGEALILASDLEAMVSRSCAQKTLDEATGTVFLAFLRENPAALQMPQAWGALGPARADQLVRAGFLTAAVHSAHQAGDATTVYSRPEDRHTLTSLETVAQAASGSMAAVGGAGGVVSAGGSGAGRGAAGTAADSGAPGSALRIAVPGNGAFLKLVSAAVAQLVDLLEGTEYGEMPERDLGERWDGGVATGAAARAKKSRGEFVGVMPGRTKKWKEFYGLEFCWVLREAVGAGVVEVFETRSVGRAVRLV